LHRWYWLFLTCRHNESCQNCLSLGHVNQTESLRYKVLLAARSFDALSLTSKGMTKSLYVHMCLSKLITSGSNDILLTWRRSRMLVLGQDPDSERMPKSLQRRRYFSNDEELWPYYQHLPPSNPIISSNQRSRNFSWTYLWLLVESAPWSYSSYFFYKPQPSKPLVGFSKHLKVGWKCWVP